jgi:HemY protein
MRRAIVFAVLAAVAVLAAYWLARHPGQVTIDWLGYRMEPPVGLAVLAVLVFSAVMVLLYRVVRAVLGTPRRIGRALAANRRKRGYKALSQGMVAVAAGDAQEAARWARRADDLLEDPPITLLLSAQAAQLNGDERAAEKYFNAMLEKPETRFLGLRGLLMQALREGDHRRALGYARQAHALRPKTPWVVTNLFELSQRTGDLDGAAAALKQVAKLKVMGKAEADHKSAVITLAKAERALAEGREEEALGLARTADRSDPDFLAAALLHARLAVARKAWREAAKVIERSWPRTPSAELAALYRAAAPEAKPLEQVKRVAKLAALNPEHRESHLALAEANLEAGLWGEVRRHLGHLVSQQGEDPPRAQVCRVMARLEEAERHDASAARRWLERAAVAPPDPAWVCDRCGAVATRWSANCGSCQSFDSLDWRLPRRVSALSAADAVEREGALALIAAKAPPAAVPSPAPAVAGSSTAVPPRLPAVAPLPAPPDRAKPAEGAASQARPSNEPARPADRNNAAEEDDSDEAAAVEGYLPPRPS